jgi:hypothetical protein
MKVNIREQVRLRGGRHTHLADNHSGVDRDNIGALRAIKFVYFPTVRLAKRFPFFFVDEDLVSQAKRPIEKLIRSWPRTFNDFDLHDAACE